MNEILYNKIANSTAHRASREQNAAYIFSNLKLFDDLFSLSLNTSDKHHHKACWIMELVLEQQLDLVFPKTDIFCHSLEKYSNDSAIRSISKIALFLTEHHMRKQKQNQIFLSEENLQKIIEVCFDWLINDIKVASKAYAMQALYLLGKNNTWIYPDLKQIISQDFTSHSAGYQSIARKILKKI